MTITNLKTVIELNGHSICFIKKTIDSDWEIDISYTGMVSFEQNITDTLEKLNTLREILEQAQLLDSFK